MPGKRRRGPAWGKLALIVAVVAVLAAAWRWTPLAEIVTVENVLRWTRAVRDTWWAPIAMVAAYTPGSLVLFPRPVMTLVSVLSFGVLLGLVWATLGVLLAALATYGLGRLMKRETLRRLAGDDFEKAGNWLVGGAVVLLVAFTVVARRVLAKRFRAA